MQLKKPGFTFSTCGPFTKNIERIKKFKKKKKTQEIQDKYTKMN